MRRGYKVGEQVVRHAMVGVVDTVSNGDAENTAENADAAPDEAAESKQDNFETGKEVTRYGPT